MIKLNLLCDDCYIYQYQWNDHDRSKEAYPLWLNINYIAEISISTRDYSYLLITMDKNKKFYHVYLPLNPDFNPDDFLTK